MTILEFRIPSTPGTKPIWGERLDELKGYLAEGMSYGTIALKFGTSRGAISGAVNRHGLRDPDKPRQPRVSKPPRTSAGRERKQRTTERLIESSPALSGDEATDILVEFVPPNPVRLMQLEDHHCRFPSGESPSIMFCGEMARDDGPYCTAHARVCYQPHRGLAPRKSLLRNAL